MEHPFVSVLMPAYNCEAYIERSMKGILAQSYTNFEFIIINDGSTDGTKNKILLFNDKRIRYFENDTNRGLVATLNRGLKFCKGKYILRADADDFAFPFIIKNFVQFMEAHPDHVVCGANIRIRYPGRYQTFRYPSEDRQLRVYALDGCPFSSHTFIRRSILQQHDLCYRDHFYPGEDHGLWSEMLQYGKLHNIQKVSSIYNKSNTSSITAAKRYKYNYSIARRNIFESHARNYLGLNEEDTALYIRLHACGDRFLQEIIPKEPASPQALAKMAQLVLRIIKNNDQHLFFDKKYLRRFFALKWTLACYNAHLSRPKTWFIYFKWLKSILYA